MSTERQVGRIGNPSQEVSDGMLVEAVLEGRKDCFAELVARYRPALDRLARSRLGRADAAEDVVQETFLSAFKSLPSYNSKYSFRTWLWTILLNHCNRYARKAGRRPRVKASAVLLKAGLVHQQEQAESDPASTPLEMVLQRERAELLEQQLARLPKMQADALRLRFFAGLKFHEIADVMGCSLSSAKNRVRCGLEKIGRKLSAYEDSDEGPAARSTTWRRENVL